jgi:ribonuclease D
MSLARPVFINNIGALRKYVPEWAKSDIIAVDTEANSMYAYYTRVCLIQLSTREMDYILDPLPFNSADLKSFGEILSDSKIEKVFHAAEYDLIGLRRDFNFVVNNIFDTSLAVRLCGLKAFALNDVLQNYFDVTLDKKHQLDDWSERPIPPQRLLYAQRDTHYLIDLRDLLKKQLEDMGRWEEAQEAFADLAHIAFKEPQFDPDGYWKIGRPSALNRRQMAILREVYLLRDQIARRENVPPVKVVTNPVLVELSRIAPTHIRDLPTIRGFSERQARVYGEDFLKAVMKGQSAPLPRPPVDEPIDPVLVERYTQLQNWRKGRAIARDLDASLIVPRPALWELARLTPHTIEEMSVIPGLGPWRLKQYGEELLTLISKWKR